MTKITLWFYSHTMYNEYNTICSPPFSSKDDAERWLEEEAARPKTEKYVNGSKFFRGHYSLKTYDVEVDVQDGEKFVVWFYHYRKNWEYEEYNTICSPFYGSKSEALKWLNHKLLTPKYVSGTNYYTTQNDWMFELQSAEVQSRKSDAPHFEHPCNEYVDWTSKITIPEIENSLPPWGNRSSWVLNLIRQS